MWQLRQSFFGLTGQTLAGGTASSIDWRFAAAVTGRTAIPSDGTTGISLRNGGRSLGVVMGSWQVKQLRLPPLSV